MSETELNRLEREVEAAREQFGRDLERLRSPAAVAGFKADLLADVQASRDEIVGKTKAAATAAADQFLSDLKRRAAANPVAVAAIGAGLAWRFAAHPPVASVLVGFGIASLLRTPPDSPEAQIVTRAEELAVAAKEKIEQWRADAPNAGELVNAVNASFHELGARAGNSAVQFADVAKAATKRGSERLTRTWRDGEERDKYLLGTAALAIAGALGIAYQRRAV